MAIKDVINVNVATKNGVSVVYVECPEKDLFFDYSRKSFEVEINIATFDKENIENIYKGIITDAILNVTKFTEYHYNWNEETKQLEAVEGVRETQEFINESIVKNKRVKYKVTKK